MNKLYIAIVSLLAMLPAPTLAHDASRNHVKSADSIDYLLGGALTLKNGRIDKYQFGEGYCQAVKYRLNASQDDFTFCYYDRDHLGSVRQVTKASSANGKVIQKMDYYPFGLEFCDGSTNSNVQPHNYNGKELDLMHGLNTYDYGARQYDPALARWDRVDPLSEKYYSISPYAYCGNNPVIKIDPDGRDPVYSSNGCFLGNSKEGFTGQIYVYTGDKTLDFEKMNRNDLVGLKDSGLMTYEAFIKKNNYNPGLSSFVSNVMTDIMSHFEGTDVYETKFSMSTLYNSRVDYKVKKGSNFSTGHVNDKIHISVNQFSFKDYEATVENLASTLIVHEWYGHGVKRDGSTRKQFSMFPCPNHHVVYGFVKDNHRFYDGTTENYKRFVNNLYKKYHQKERFYLWLWGQNY